MKIKELRAMNRTELLEKFTELSKELIKERATTSTGTTPKSPARIRNAKRTIARIHHVLASAEARHP